MRAPTFKGNVIISNLPTQLTAAELADLFDEFGLVLGAKIDRWHDRPGGSKGSVDLAPDTSVDKAIAALHGQTVNGTKISVKRAPKAEPKPKSASAPAGAPSRPIAPPRPAMSYPSDFSRSAPPSPSIIAAKATDDGYDAVRPLRSAAMDFPAAAPSSRQVVVEYRAPRRVILPPRTAKIRDSSAG